PPGSPGDDDPELDLEIERMAALRPDDRIAVPDDRARELSEDQRPLRHRASGALGDVVAIVQPDADDLAGAHRWLGHRVAPTRSARGRRPGPRSAGRRAPRTGPRGRTVPTGSTAPPTASRRAAPTGCSTPSRAAPRAGRSRRAVRTPSGRTS